MTEQEYRDRQARLEAARQKKTRAAEIRLAVSSRTGTPLAAILACPTPVSERSTMLGVRLRIGLLGLVSVAALSVTSVTAQTPCYLPDGTMYLGNQRPADCSPVRPKSREEAIQRS